MASSRRCFETSWDYCESLSKQIQEFAERSPYLFMWHDIPCHVDNLTSRKS